MKMNKAILKKKINFKNKTGLQKQKIDRLK